MKSISITVNAEPVEAQVDPRMQLAELLREELGLTGAHLGCEHGVCGACTVMIDGKPMRSCINFAVACDGAEIETVEGFADDAVMQRLRLAFSEHHALQCGFCTPGMLVTARDVVLRLDTPDESRIREELAGNLCRCTGYMGIVNAISAVIGERAGSAGRDQPAIAPREALPRFEPRDVGIETSGVSESTAALDVMTPEGWVQLTEVIEVRFPPAEVWQTIEDIERVARCMPGAELTSVEGDSIEGLLRVRLGPMSAAFAGQGKVALDRQALRGRITGEGADRASASRASGALSFALEPLDEGAATRIVATVSYQVTGPFAQFGRSGLMRDFARQLTAAFAGNLARELSGETVSPTDPKREVRAGGLLISVLWQRLKSLLGYRSS